MVFADVSVRAGLVERDPTHVDRIMPNVSRVDLQITSTIHVTGSRFLRRLDRSFVRQPNEPPGEARLNSLEAIRGYLTNGSQQNIGFNDRNAADANDAGNLQAARRKI